MGKILQSFEDFEVRLPSITVGGRRLPEVLLPKRQYFKSEIDRGMRPVVELTDAQWERVMADEVTSKKIGAAKGGYRVLSHIPAYLQSPQARVGELEAENARLRDENQRLRDEGRGASVPPVPETLDLPGQEA